MKKEVKAILFNPEEGQLADVVLQPDDRGHLLSSIYLYLDCDMIEAARLTENLEVYVDENGLLVDNPIYGALYVANNGRVVGGLAGNLLFVNHNELGETVDLTEEQREEISMLTLIPITYRDGKHRTAIIIPQEEK